MRGLKIGGLLLAIVLLAGLWAAPSSLAEEKPRRGGILRVALAGDPPSLDMHQEQTFLVTIPFSPVYNTLVMFDPHGYPNIIGDLAKSWTLSDDKMAGTVRIAVTDGLATYWLMPQLIAFNRSHPAIRVEIATVNSWGDLAVEERIDLERWPCRFPDPGELAGDVEHVPREW